MKKALWCFFLLSACSGIHLKPGPDKTAEPVFQRGWSYIESEKDFLDQDAGVAQVSYSSPQIVGEKIVFGSERFGLTVLAKKNGQVIWQKRVGDGISSQPFILQDAVIAGTDSGELYKFDLASGREIWQLDLNAPVTGSMVFSGDRLFVSTEDEAIRAIDPSTGKILWNYRRPAFGGTSIRGGGHPAVVGGKVWIGFSDGSLVALDPQDGSVSWEKQFHDNVKFMDIDARVVGWRDGILVTTYDGKLRYMKKDGALIWEFAAGGARAPVLADGERLFLPSSDGSVYAINSSGKQIWSYFPRRGVPTSVAFMSGTNKKILLVGISEQKILALDSETGKILAQTSFGRSSGSFAPIAVDQETKTFFVLSNFSRLHQFYFNL